MDASLSRLECAQPELALFRFARDRSGGVYALLLRGAEVALARLGEAQTPDEQAFYEGKVAAARWFARTVLPRLTAERVAAERTDLAVMDLPETAF